jgi:hypothetical protein
MSKSSVNPVMADAESNAKSQQKPDRRPQVILKLEIWVIFALRLACQPPFFGAVGFVFSLVHLQFGEAFSSRGRGFHHGGLRFLDWQGNHLAFVFL